ncbi:hypothetical protein Tco_1451769 [Tanacetum coccineum]
MAAVEAARLRMVVLAVGGDGGDDGEVVVMVLVDVVVAVVAVMVRRGWPAVVGGDVGGFVLVVSGVIDR